MHAVAVPGLIKKHGQLRRIHRLLGLSEMQVTRGPSRMGIKCPKCHDGELTERVHERASGGPFYGCYRYPDCDFTTPHMPIPEPCPKCGAPFIVEKRSKIGTVRTCIKEGCDWEMEVPEVPIPAVPEPVGTAQS